MIGRHLAGHTIIQAVYYTHIVQGDTIVSLSSTWCFWRSCRRLSWSQWNWCTLVIATPMIAPVWCAALLSGQCRICQLWNLLVHLSTCCLLLFSVSLVLFSWGLCWVLTEII